MSSTVGFISSVKPETVPLPKHNKLWRNLPVYAQVPRIHFQGANHPNYAAHQAEEAADQALLDTLLVEGFDDNYVPWKGEWLAVCLAGAVSFALNGTLLQPQSCDYLIRRDDDLRLYKCLWQFVWQWLRLRRQNVFVSPTLKASLYRLMVAHQHDSHWDNEAARIWWDFKYCPDDQNGWGEMAHSVYKRARKIKSYDKSDQLFLGFLVKGMGEMLKLVSQEVPKLY